MARRMKPTRRISILSFIFITASLFVACNSPGEPAPPDCTANGVAIIPTATRQTDPDLFSLPALPDGGDGATYCPTPIPADILAEEFPEQFITTGVANLSLDIANQDLAATAVGDDMLAAAWLSDGDVYVALARGGNHFQVRRVDSGGSVSLAFSRANRLHVTYVQDGRILYRAADQGTHPADVAPLVVEDALHPVVNGRTPQVVVDELNWAHVLYEQDGSIFKAKHLSNETWLTQFVAYGTDPAVMPFYNEKELVLWGAPTGTYWFGIIMAAPYNGEIRVFRYLSWFNVWEQIAAFPILSGEELTGAVGLDFLAASEDEAWVYASWVTKRPFPDPPLPLYVQPIYEAVNPLFPNQIANPNHIYQGLNAVRWRSEDAPFDAGLRQTISIPDPNGAVTFAAWGLAETADGNDLTLRIGIDPTGGDNPDSPTVVWSSAAAPADFTQLSVTVSAQGGAATVFLRGTLNTADMSGTAVWDAVTVQNGVLTNGDFEGSFLLQDSLPVPEGWTAWYQDSGYAPTNGRDVYTIYAAWSDNGGSAWTGPEAVTANRDLSGGVTGAIRPDVTPFISLATEPPSISFFYIYETGDPPPDTTFLRFGRPYQTQCELGTANCTGMPGIPLLPRNVVRPAYRLLAAADPFDPGRAVLLWDSLQTDIVYKDVYATYVVLR
ncbi:MAG: hypothetical protein IPM39_27910 [Chloroflexi bacterium]|nr:hypothetical protein [Chloroflexota bacterium]